MAKVVDAGTTKTQAARMEMRKRKGKRRKWERRKRSRDQLAVSQ